MAADKLVDSEKLKTALVATAETIRTKGGTTAQIAFDYDDEPTGFKDAIENLLTPPKKKVKITNNTSKTIKVRYLECAKYSSSFSPGIDQYNTGTNINPDGASKTFYPVSGSALLIESGYTGTNAHIIALGESTAEGYAGNPYLLYHGNGATWVNTSWLVLYSSNSKNWTSAELTIIDG